MNTLALSLLIATSSFLQETRTCIKAWMSPTFKHIRPLTTDLPVLERLYYQYIKPQSHIHGFGPGRATVHPDLSNRGASA